MILKPIRFFFNNYGCFVDILFIFSHLRNNTQKALQSYKKNFEAPSSPP